MTERDRLRLLRETLATRRRNLSAAKLHSTSFVVASPVPPAAAPLPPPLPTTFALHQTASRERQELGALSMTIARARSGLVQELVEVFNVVEVGGRPPVGGKLGTKGEWTIGTLTLPVPGDMRSEYFHSILVFPFAACMHVAFISALITLMYCCPCRLPMVY